MQVTINKIEAPTVDVTFVLDDGTEVNQNINGLPLDNLDNLHQALSNYGVAYQAGLAIEKAQASAEVTAAIGKPFILETTSDTVDANPSE